MARAKSRDRFDELWDEIDDQYFLFSLVEDHDAKVEAKEKLFYLIREFLYFAPQNRKYAFAETAHIIRRSATTKPNFNPIKAASAWNAIGKYAINLVLQPWRKEFRELKTFCGYYKHEIDEHLADAELMFELMGFSRISNSVMVITDGLDEDRITSVSRDSLIASMECQILRDIWENVTPHYDFSWAEILEYRENHTGSSEQAVKTLKFLRRQQLYEQEAYLRANHVPLDFVYGSNPGCYNRIYYNHTRSSSSRPHEAPASLPQVVSSSQVQEDVLHPTEIEQVDDVQDSQSSNELPVNLDSVQGPLPDSYVDTNNSSFDSDSSVPAGQIQLDKSQFQVHEPPKDCVDSDEPASSGEKGEEDKTTKVRKPKKPDSELWEDWDYVNDSFDVNKAAEVGRNKKATNTEGGGQGKDSGDATKGPKPKGTGRAEGGKKHEKEASPVIKRDPGHSRITYKKGKESEIEIYIEKAPERKSKHRSRIDDEDNFNNEDDSSMSGNWQCITCTFMNKKDKTICEMCCKSKDPGDEYEPRPEEGVICKKCTLINEKGRHFCEACGKRLTYTAVCI